MKHCLWCNKPLVRKTYHRKDKRKGKVRLETDKEFAKRLFCKRGCVTEWHCTIWTKETVIKAFNKIKTDKKFNSTYMKKRHQKLYSAIKRIYGKNPWSKFLIETKHEDKILCNYINSKHKLILRALITYLSEELDIKPKQKFSYSAKWGLPVEPYNSLPNLHSFMAKAFEYGIKHKKLRLIKKGRAVGGQRDQIPSQYVYLTNRI